MSVVNNANQFLTLDFVKNHFGITDNQDDDTLLGIVQACNLEMKKRLIGVVDSITQLEGTQFFASAQSVALVFCEAEIRRLINLMITEAAIIMERFIEMVETLRGEVRSQAPVRTSRNIASRDTDYEDDFFAERRTV